MKTDKIKDTEFKITSKAVLNSSTNIIPKGNVIIATRVGLGKIIGLIERLFVFGFLFLVMVFLMNL
jgi:hypothetical protein